MGFMIFDGKGFAAKLEEKLRQKVMVVGRVPRLVILVSAGNESGKIYSKKKKEMGDRIGIKVEIVEILDLKEQVVNLANDNTIDGLMVQLPLLRRGFAGQAVLVGKEETQKILDLIPVKKDVDGLTSENFRLIATGEQAFLPATIKAVGKVMDEAIREIGLDIERMKVAVVGSKGMVGKPLVSQLKRFGFEVGEFEVNDELKLADYDVVISATGKEGLIKPEMVKKGVVVIDVGFPKGDFETDVSKNSSFFTSVPGGVGPVTVVCLMENVVEAL